MERRDKRRPVHQGEMFGDLSWHFVRRQEVTDAGESFEQYQEGDPEGCVRGE